MLTLVDIGLSFCAGDTIPSVFPSFQERSACFDDLYSSKALLLLSQPKQVQRSRNVKRHQPLARTSFRFRLVDDFADSSSIIEGCQLSPV